MSVVPMMPAEPRETPRGSLPRAARQAPAVADDVESVDRVVMSLAMTIEARDPYTLGHCQRLARYATLLGERLGLGAGDLITLQRGAFLHDVGKVGIPDAVLFKRGALTPEEHAVMQQHTVIGDRLCEQLTSLVRVRAIIRHHHERLDGTGYPDRLRGDQIPLMAQIVSIVDLFDAVTTSRPYKKARSQAAAFQCLREEVALGWKRQDLVEEFLLALDDSLPLVNGLDRNVA